MSATTELCDRLVTLAEGYCVTEELSSTINRLRKSSGTADSEQLLEELADIYLQRGCKREFLEVTKALLPMRLGDARVRNMHKLACMLMNIQSST